MLRLFLTLCWTLDNNVKVISHTLLDAGRQCYGYFSHFVGRWMTMLMLFLTLCWTLDDNVKVISHTSLDAGRQC